MNVVTTDFRNGQIMAQYTSKLAQQAIAMKKAKCCPDAMEE